MIFLKGIKVKYADIPCIIGKDGTLFSLKYSFPSYIENEEWSPKKPHGNMSFHVWSVKMMFLSCKCDISFWWKNKQSPFPTKVTFSVSSPKLTLFPRNMILLWIARLFQGKNFSFSGKAVHHWSLECFYSCACIPVLSKIFLYCIVN